MMTSAQSLAWSVNQLRQANIDTPVLESEYLLAAVLRCPRLELLFHAAKSLSATEHQVLRRYVRERSKHKPLAYIVGEQPFRDLSLRVQPAVLIPRPETES